MLDELLIEAVFIVYEVLTVAAPSLLVFAFVSRYRTKHGTNSEKGRLGVFIVLLLYITAVMSATGAGTLYDYLRTGFEYNPERINLIPFIMDSYPAQYTLNVVMFVPFGLLLPLVWPGVAKARYVGLYGLVFSLMIELSQLLNYRATDIDDLLMNTLGALIGFGIYALIRHLRKTKTPKEAGSKTLPALYLSVMFLGHFFLYNGLGFAMLLYGSGIQIQ